MLDTTPLKSQEYLDGCAGENSEADEIEVVMELRQDVAYFWLYQLVWDAREDHEDGRKAADREVDVETPSPRGVLCEGSANQGSAHDSKLAD